MTVAVRSTSLSFDSYFAASNDADQADCGHPWFDQIVSQQGAELDALPGGSGRSSLCPGRVSSRSDPCPPMFHVRPSACARTAFTATTLTLSRNERIQAEIPQHEGQPGPRVSLSAQLLPAVHQQGLARLGARCLMAVVLSVSATSAGASAAAERGEWQPRRHHRRLEPEELREYAQATHTRGPRSTTVLTEHRQPCHS